jgi:hypothetical protein
MRKGGLERLGNQKANSWNNEIRTPWYQHSLLKSKFNTGHVGLRDAPAAFTYEHFIILVHKFYFNNSL